MKPANPDSELPLDTQPNAQLATVSTEPSVGQMLQTFLANPESAKNVEVAERMFALYERAEARNAEKQFNSAFVALQADLPVIVAKTIIPNRGKYERFEDVMSVVAPLLQKHGFSVSFSMDVKETRVLETCHLRHIGGHSQSNSFAVRTGRADTETQADCKAATTAKRNALLNCLNIVIRQDAMLGEDDDASLEGAFISADKVDYLREQLKEAGGNEAAFLAMAGAAKLEEITDGSYPVLVRALEMKKRK